MRRFLYLLLIMTVVICVGSYQNRAEAADEYIGNNSYGNEVYLVTESVRETMLSHRGYFDGYQYDCRVKCVYPDTREYYTDEYSFVCNTGMPYWSKNGVRASRSEVSANHQRGDVESKLLEYFYKYSRASHPNQWKSEKVLSR